MTVKWMASAAVIALCSTCLLAADQPKPGLGHDMGDMGKAFKVLHEQIKDASKNQDSLTQIVAMETATLAAKGMTPPKLPGKTDTDPAKTKAEFQSMIATCLMEELSVEQALLDGDNDTAAKKLDELADTMQAGHKEFRPARKGQGGAHPHPTTAPSK